MQCLTECQNYYGLDRWVAGHRNGASGLANPNTQDIQSKSRGQSHICGKGWSEADSRADYRNGVNYIQTQLTTQPNGLTNDVRYWVYVVPI